MKLIRITARNFKGLDFDEEVSPLTVYGGSNFAGKSARLDAIRLLILGHLPELGKQNRETFRLSSGAEMSVQGIFADGDVQHLFARSWRVEGDSIKREISGALKIRELLEDDDRLRVMLDANSYFALTERQRVAYVFANTTMPDGWTSDAVRAKVQTALEELPRAKEDDVRDRIEKEFSAAAKAKMPLPETIEFVAERVAEMESFEREYAGRMEKTVQGLSALRLADEKTENDADLRKIHEELAQRRMVQVQDHADKKAKFASVLLARRRREEIRGEGKATAGMEAKLADLKTRLADASGQLALIQVPSPIEERDLRQNAYHARELESNTVLCTKQDGQAKERLERELAGLQAQDSCPYCGAAGEGWKQIKGGELRAQIAELEKTLAAREIELTEMREHRTVTTTAVDRIEISKRRATELTAAVSGLKDEIAHVEKFLARTEGLKAEEARLPAEDPELETATKMAELQVGKTNEEIAAVVARIHKIAGRTEELKRLAAAELGRDKAKNNWQVARTASLALRQIKAEVVEKALQPLLASANSIFETILQTPIAYHDGEIGTFRGPVWVSHHTLSGVEKALTYAAIQAALAEQSPVRLMLFDELARIHDAFLPEFVRIIVRLLEEKRLDGFVGIDPSRRSFYESCTTGIPTFKDGTWLLYRQLE